MKREIAVLCLSVLALAGSVRAELAGTLLKIHDTGMVNVGYREDVLPFSYLALGDRASGKNGPVGFAIDLCMRVVETLRLELDRPLRVTYVPVTPENRFDRMQERAIDIECGSTTNTRERREKVDFSVTYFVARVRMLVRRDSGVKDYADLVGRRVAVTTGTTAEACARELLKRQSPSGVKPSERTAAANPTAEACARELLQRQSPSGVKPSERTAAADHDAQPCRAASSGTSVPFELKPVGKHVDGLRLVESREACAFLLDDALLAAEAARSPDPSLFSIVGEALSQERYGLMLPHGDARFKTLVDRVLIGLMKSGEAEKLYERWFVKEIPAGNLNLNPAGNLKLNLPMSPDLRMLFEVPSDEEARSTRKPSEQE